MKVAYFDIDAMRGSFMAKLAKYEDIEFKHYSSPEDVVVAQTWPANLILWHSSFLSQYDIINELDPALTHWQVGPSNTRLSIMARMIEEPWSPEDIFTSIRDMIEARRR
jgi:hypothetical protein